MKLGDAHLRTLEQRIALHEERLVQSHARGDTSAVVQNTDALRQLYMEHKGKLDDMLFFWIFGGSVCIAGWVRAAWVYNHREQDLRASEAELRAALSAAVREAVHEHLAEAAAGGEASPPPAVAAEPPAAGAGEAAAEVRALRRELGDSARALRLAAAAAAAGCALSAASLAVGLLAARR